MIVGDRLKIARFEARIHKMRAEVRSERRLREAAARAGVADLRLVVRNKGGRDVGIMSVAPPPPEAVGSGVYVLREEGTNFVKIGWTSNFRQRYQSMRTTLNPRRLVFVGWLSRGDNEGHFHRKYRAYHVGANAGGAEWFELPDEQLAGLMAACVEVPR